MSKSIKAQRAWSGIGSRQSPKPIFRLQARIGMALTLMGWHFSSGGAHGSDEAFELGVDLAMHMSKREDLESVKSIYIPWEGFRQRTLREAGVRMPSMKKAIELTSRYHPGWDKISSHDKRLMARNAFQILSENLARPVDRVICYTEDGAQVAEETSYKTGGTGQAIRIATDYKVTVVNIGRDEQREVMENWLNEFDQRLAKQGMATTLEAINSLLDQYITLPSRKGDLVELADLGEFDAIVHGCNCFNTMGAGVAKAISGRWPQAVEVDNMTNKGDKHKLGDYTSVYVDTQAGKGALQLVNGYTQYQFGKDPYVCYVNYEKVRRLFQTLNQDLIGKRVGIPMIGAGLANGEWYVIERLIKEAAPEMDLTVVIL